MVLLHQVDHRSDLLADALQQPGPHQQVLALVVGQQHPEDDVEMRCHNFGACGVTVADTAYEPRGEAELAAEHGVRDIHVAHIGHGNVGCRTHKCLSLS